MHWYGAGGPAYYLEDGGRVTAILFWSEADVGQSPDGDFSVMDAGWSVVLTATGGRYDLDEAPSLDGLGDEKQVEAINEAVELAAQLVREES
jgi:hypothetical protein